MARKVPRWLQPTPTAPPSPAQHPEPPAPAHRSAPRCRQSWVPSLSRQRSWQASSQPGRPRTRASSSELSELILKDTEANRAGFKNQAKQLQHAAEMSYWFGRTDSLLKSIFSAPAGLARGGGNENLCQKPHGPRAHPLHPQHTPGSHPAPVAGRSPGPAVAS